MSVSEDQAATDLLEMRAVLGPHLVDYLGAPERVAVARQAAEIILQGDGPDTFRAWFIGMNPDLDDISPAELLHDGDIADVGPMVLSAARAHLSS